MSDTDCPCGSATPMARCCGPVLDDPRAAATAEALMRSRYTAFVLGRADHLLETWHAGTRPPQVAPEPERRWLGLRVLRCERGRSGDTDGVVEFVARSKRAGRATRLHETSRFVFERDRWWYVGGDVHPR